MTKTKIGVPKGKRSTHNLSCQSITTTDLFKVQPVFIREVFKGDVFDINTYQINRVEQLPVSSFVRIDNNHQWFFVKMSQIWKPFDSLMTKTPYAFNYLNTIPSEVPYFTTLDLLFPFIGPSTESIPIRTSLCEVVSVSNPSGDDIKNQLVSLRNHSCDLIYVRADGTQSRTYTFTDLGRKYYSLLYSLGYRIPKFVNVSNTTFTDSDGVQYAPNLHLFTLHQSLLPLMAYMSIYLNYYTPTKFRDYSFVNSLSYLVTLFPHVIIDSNGQWQNTTDITNFYKSLLVLLAPVWYGSDYFTDSLVEPYDMKVDTLYDESTAGTSNVNVVQRNTPSSGAPVVRQISSATGIQPTDYILSALKAVSNKSQIQALTKNNMLATALQMFGYKPESSDMIPYLLSQHFDQIVVDELISLADTKTANSGTQLGYKAGNGQGRANFDDHFEFDDYGFLICCNTVSPDYFYYEGLHKEMFHTKSEDFFDPAYVNLGFQPIAQGEVSLQTLPENNPLVPRENYKPFPSDDTFGFQNKYAEYGYRRDFMGGEFCVNSVNTGLDSYHFGRKFEDLSVLAIGNNSTFARAVSTYFNWQTTGAIKNQYNRIFSVTLGGVDHIQQWTWFKILATRSIPENGEWTVGTDDENSVEGTGVTDNINA